jgi:hypothetical protein
MRPTGFRLPLACATAAVATFGGVLAVGSTTARPAAGGPAPAALDDAADFAAHVVRLIAANDYGSAWPLLHPGHQRVAGRAGYESCEALSPIPGELERLRVLDVRRERVDVPGVGRPVPGVAVRLSFRLADRTLGMSVRVAYTVHVVRVDGGWRWLLPAARYELYRSGRCASVAAPTYGR